MNADFFPIRTTIQVQTKNGTFFSQTIRNFEINSNTLRDIDKRKMRTKLNEVMTTRKYSRLYMMKLYLRILLKKYYVFRKIFEISKLIQKNCEVLMRGICIESFIEL